MEHDKLDSNPPRPLLAVSGTKKAGSLIPSERQILISTLITGGVLAAASVVFFFSSSPPSVQVPQVAADSGVPVRLIIPAITVDAAMEYVGLATDGVMGVPEDPANAGWFELGPRPGETGSAVIAGHYGWKDNRAAVFDTLYKLQAGDRVYVENGRGEIATFVVREVRSYDPQADAAAVFGSDDGKAHLNLITCEGTWNSAQKSYSKRLVIFTDELEP